MKQEGVEVDFQSWKWISLRHRRRFVFTLLNVALCAMWISLYFTQNSQQYHFNSHRRAIFVNGGILIISSLHTIVFFLSVCDSRLQLIIENNNRLGKRLVHAVVLSLFLVSSFGVSVYSSNASSLTMLELSSSTSAVMLIIPRILHNMGYCQAQIILFGGLFCMSGSVLLFRIGAKEFSYNYWIMMLSAIGFSLMDLHIHENDYKYHFEELKITIHSKEKEKNFDFKDIISTVNTVVDMINQLEFDIRYRISRGMEYYFTYGSSKNGTIMEREKLNANMCTIGQGIKSPFPIEISNKLSICKVGSESLKSHHTGYLYHIETLCEAISISLSSKDNIAFREDKDGSFYLSEMIENIFWAFEDTFLPRVVPLFFDSAFGDLYVQKTSRKCLETIVFLILFDSIYGKYPGFCSVSFECQRQGGIGHAKTVQLVITKSSNSSNLLKQKNSISNSRDDFRRMYRDDANETIGNFTTKHTMREFSSSYIDAPQIILADRLALQYLNARVCGSGPQQNGHLSTHSWRVDISSLQTQQHDERIPLICDLQDHLYRWKLFHDSSCSSADLHIYQGFKNTLTKLGVAFTVGDIKGGIDNKNRRKKHKICVIHERILNQLKDAKLRLLISKAANVIVLVDVEITRRDAAFFGVRQFTPNISPQYTSKVEPPTFERRTLPEEFCRLVRLQVYSNVSPTDFINQFKEFRVEPKNVQAFEEQPFRKTAAQTDTEPEGITKPNPHPIKTFPIVQPHHDVSPRDQNQDLVYLKAVGVTISISSCWHQMLNDWKVDPNGYPRLLQMLHLCYGFSAGKGDKKRNKDKIVSITSSESINNQDEQENSLQNSAAETTSFCDGISSSSASTRSLIVATNSHSNASLSRQLDHSQSPCSFEKLKTINLQQPQQREFEALDKQISELFTHACLSLHTIEKILCHAKEDGVPAELPSLNYFSHTEDGTTRNSTAVIDKSLLTIVNNTAYGSSGGGIVYYYFLTTFVKPLNKVRTLVGMMEHSEKQDEVTKTAIECYFLSEFISGLDTLQDHCKRDDLSFLWVWLNCIKALFSENLKRCRGEALKVVPMMLDIAENALWGISDSCRPHVN